MESFFLVWPKEPVIINVNEKISAAAILID